MRGRYAVYQAVWNDAWKHVRHQIGYSHVWDGLTGGTCYPWGSRDIILVFFQEFLPL
jgi:hypothetical protein